MPTKTLRLEHAELCSECLDLLQPDVTVLVDEGCRVICLSCAPERRADLAGFERTDPWTWIDDPDLRELLRHRVAARVPARPRLLAISA